MAIDFFVGDTSGLPVVAQLQEQVRLALLVGQLRPGDTLPSIRDVAAQIGVNRGVVHKAYTALQKAGILTLRRGKGVLVDKELHYNHAGNDRKAQKLADEILMKLRTKCLCPSAFTRYLSQRARAEEDKFPFIIYADITKQQALERAHRISGIWQVHIEGLSFQELETLDKDVLSRIRKALTSYLRVDRVRKILKDAAIEVIPIGLRVKAQTIREFKSWPARCSVLLLMDDGDVASAPFVIDLYKRHFLPGQAIVTARGLGTLNVSRLLASKKYDRIIFANSIWEQLPQRLRRNPHATHAQVEIDLASVESARIGTGVIF
jgi:DNA-binding transcriptional regulator YhcF (GntR family)